MKLELKALRYNMINNLIIAIIKVAGGIFFKLGSLYADGMHTFSDFITDIVCMVSSKVTKKRPTKYHPYGFGQVEYLTNLFVGIVLLALGLFIIINAFLKRSESTIPPLSVLIVLVVSFVLKLIAIRIMNTTGKKINSNVLITSVQESKADLYSTIGVVIITILLQFSDTVPVLKYADFIGSMIIGFIVLKTAYTIIVSNSLSIIGETEKNTEVNDEICEYLKKYKKIINQKIELLKYGPYYKLHLTLQLDPNISLKQAEKMMATIKRDLVRTRSLKIKYVTIYLTDKI